MSYDDIATFSKSWGLVYLCLLFLGVLVYALKPSNKAKFDKAARMPLDEEHR